MKDRHPGRWINGTKPSHFFAPHPLTSPGGIEPAIAGLRDRRTRHCPTGTRAPPEGIEPPTGRLTAGCPATRRRWNAIPGEGLEPSPHGFRDRRPASWTTPEQTPLPSSQTPFFSDSLPPSVTTRHSGGTTRTRIRGSKVPRPANWTTPEQIKSGMRESNSPHQLGRLRPRPLDQSREYVCPQKESNLPKRVTRPLRCHLRHEGALPRRCPREDSNLQRTD